MKMALKRLVALAASVSLLSTTLVGVAGAAMVDTQSAVAMEQRAEHVAEVKEWLAQDNVKEQLTRLGVDPSDAAKRVSSMTAQELAALHNRIDELPAGSGLVGVIGIVFVVFIILELLGVTNVFTGF